ncbi:hypothetical protein PI124_g12778 [Phytophthora idaei]|nr:hypothetical protein PI125_g19745 [Phytophthora idaei]KAG3148244.1 hypothetical protein PI126_g12519 [Phytophthora idaei]KAG3242378.1 hypothetical protein PI124_g12778 [Phytophthora idaei]
MSSFRSLFILAAIWLVLVRQGDVPNAYLQAGLDKPIYMLPPRGMQLEEGKVLLLKKSLYGLKQSGNCGMQNIGFNRSRLDPCLIFDTLVANLLY